MKQRIKTLQAITRFARCRVEVARHAHAVDVQRLSTVQGEERNLKERVDVLESTIRARFDTHALIAIDDWARERRYLDGHEVALGQCREQLAQENIQTNNSRTALLKHSRDLKLAQELLQRALIESQREFMRRQDKAMDEAWLILEGGRS